MGQSFQSPFDSSFLKFYCSRFFLYRSPLTCSYRGLPHISRHGPGSAFQAKNHIAEEVFFIIIIIIMMTCYTYDKHERKKIKQIKVRTVEQRL